VIRLAALLAALAFAAPAAAATGASDLALLGERLPLLHPNPWHALPQAEFESAAERLSARLPELDRDEVAVELMRLLASLGVRDGHTGIFPLDPGNGRTFHEYPLLPYEFPNGPVVVGALGGRDLVGARILAIGGVPIRRVLALVRPLVPHDNGSSLAARRPQYLVSAEVLHGLGIARDTGPLRFDLVRPNGKRIARTLAPVTAAAYSKAFAGLRMFPPGRAHRADRAAAARLSTLSGGRVVYLAYNDTFVETYDLAQRLRRLASNPRVRRVVVDVRNNLGGDNTTYPPLVATLARLARTRDLVVLAGRGTFSAAANFLGDLEARTRYLLVGESSGGAPNLYGDAEPLDLPQTRLRVEIATIWWVKSRAGATDPRLTFRPDIVVRPRAADWLAGRDPALATALTAPAATARAIH
jgi:hypothetical protein